MGGVTYGWDNFEDVYDDMSFLGGVTFTASDGNSKLAYAMHVGDEEQTFGTVTPNDQRLVQSIVYSRTMTDRCRSWLQHDWGVQENAFGSGEDAEVVRPEHLPVLQDQLLLDVRRCGSNGSATTTASALLRPATTRRWASATTRPRRAASKATSTRLRYGLNYKPSSNRNLILRPEVRYDWYDGGGECAGQPALRRRRRRRPVAVWLRRDLPLLRA